MCIGLSACIGQPRNAPRHATSVHSTPSLVLTSTPHRLTLSTRTPPTQHRNQTLAWGGGGLLALYLANGLIAQVDRLPILPQLLQLVGFAFTSWFTFRWVPEGCCGCGEVEGVVRIAAV